MSTEARFLAELNSPTVYRKVQGNLLRNAGFEDDTASDFDNWTEDTDGGKVTITADAGTVRTGSQSCKMLAHEGGEAVGSVYQDILVKPNAMYMLKFWARTGSIFATMQGRYGVYNVTDSSWIIPRINSWGFSESDWIEVTDIFKTPAGCTTARLYLYQNINADTWCFYDDVEITELRAGSDLPLPVFGGITDMGSYSHKITRLGGFDTMNFTTAGPLSFIESWIEYGLGRDIAIRGPEGTIVWEGFINKLIVNLGGTNITVGPLADVINMGRIKYNLIDWGTTPPIKGGQVQTPFYETQASMEIYRVLQGLITGGEGKGEEMQQLANYALSYSAWPPLTLSNISIGSSGSFGMAVECKGYMHMLDKYYYEQTMTSSDIDISAKVLAVLMRDPNSIASSYIIDDNDFQVTDYEGDDKTAKAIMSGLVELGDSSGNRYSFGFEENKTFRYSVASDEIAYRYYLRTGKITSTTTHKRQKPWLARPGQWMFVQDMIKTPAVYLSSDREFDPRYQFIQDVSYTAPYSLQIASAKLSFKDRIGRLGLGGGLS